VSWRYAAASVTGTSHHKSETPCQDAHHCEVIQDEDGDAILVLIVADGAGSAKHGGEGAVVAISALMEQIAAWFANGGTIRTTEKSRALAWLDGIREAIAEVASTNSATMRDYAATLIFAVIDDRTAAFGQIGDGAVVTSNTPGEWDRQFRPERGMYANETFFVTQDDARDHLQFAHSLRPITEAALFTDGLERLLLDTAQGEAHAPVFEKMLAPLRAVHVVGHAAELSTALSKYLATPAVGTRTDDDVTLALATSRAVLGPQS
jgi:hypothetical protein